MLSNAFTSSGCETKGKRKEEKKSSARLLSRESVSRGFFGRPAAKRGARSAQHPRYRITRETLTDKRQRTQTRGRGKLHRNWSGWEMEKSVLAGCRGRKRRRIKVDRVGSRNKQVVGVE